MIDWRAWVRRQGWTERARRALKGLGQYGIALAIDAVLHVAIVPLVTRAVSASVFGSYALIMVTAKVALTAIELGTGIALIRYLPDVEDADQRRTMKATLFWSKVAIVIVAGVATAGLSGLATSPLRETLRIGALGFACWSLFFSVTDIHRATERHHVAALGLVTVAGVWAAGTLYLVVARGMGLWGLIAAHSFAYIAGVLVVTTPLGLRLLATKPSLQSLKKLLRFGVPATPYFGMRTISGLDRHLVRYRSSLDHAGYYQVAGVPSGAIELTEAVCILAAEPYIYGVAPEQRVSALERLVRIIGLFMGSCAVVLGMVAPELVALLAPADYGAAIHALAWLGFASACRALVRVVGFGAGFFGRSHVWATAGVAEIVLAAIGMYLFIPMGGLAAAGLCRFAAVLVGLGICAVWVQRLLSAKLPVLRVALYMVTSAALCTVLATPTFGEPVSLAIRVPVSLVLVVGGALLLWPRNGTGGQPATRP